MAIVTTTPLSLFRRATSADYPAARAEALASRPPGGAIWYIRASLPARMLDDGFDWIAYLNRQGNQVDAWTLDATDDRQIALARRPVQAGIDRITTNDAPRLSAVLGDTNL